MSLTATVDALARGLLLARDERDAILAWVRVQEPDASVVVLVSGAPNAAPLALGRGDYGWESLAVPPLPGLAAPKATEARHPGASRKDALDDLLWSLGVGVAAVLPLEPAESGWLVVGRAERPYAAEELDRFAHATPLLGLALVTLHRRGHGSREIAKQAREVTELFDLTRTLTTTLTIDAAAQHAAMTTRSLLGPAIGAVVVARAPGLAAHAVTWPEDASHAEAVRLAAEAASCTVVEKVVRLPALAARTCEPEYARWQIYASPEAPLALALAWAGEPPAEAPRVARSIAASLALSLARFEAQTSHEERRLATAIENLPLGIVVLDRAHRVRLANEVGRVLLESVDSWPGRGEVLTRLGSAPIPAPGSETPGDKPLELEVLLPGGERTLVARLYQRADDEQRGADEAGDVVLVITDVTEERRQARRWLQVEKHAALGVLIAGIVHEINNPLATILGYAQLLASGRGPRGEGEVNAEERAWLSTIVEEAQRCQRIIRDMLDVARPHEPGRRAVLAPALVEKALSLLAHPMRGAGIEAVLRSDPKVPQVAGDSDALLRVLLNLITNAMHALEDHPGTRVVDVRIEPSKRAGFVDVVVRDNGPGIPPEHLDRIFDPFFTTKEEGRGSGLGLALVDATVRDHGGEIEVESALGQGTCFTVTLPAAGADALEPAPSRRTGAAPAEARLEGLRVLIADDEPAIAELLREVLESAGARVSLFHEGASALRAMVEEPPDVAIIDLHMPQVGGDRLLEAVARDAPALVDRIVFATGDLRSAEGQPRFTHLGRACLAKPFDLRVVIETVREVARASAARRDDPPDR